MLKRQRWWWLAGGCVAGLVLAGGWWFFRPDPGDARLNAYVHGLPPVAIVFTSRSEPASLRAAAPHFLPSPPGRGAGGEGLSPEDGFVFPGKPLWQAREGRLRLLTPRGTVHELTWRKPLPDGGTLIDVMSPSISVNARKILFAGRRADDHGHFRLYEIGIDGQGLRPLTGGLEDAGCTALPPLRYCADGRTILSDNDRRRVDYDDVDPVYVDHTNGFIAFASSRTPDLGRGHARRATTLWLMHRDGGQKYPLTANRHNDRWPFLMTSNYLAFSLWSRNQEVITTDETDIRPLEPGGAGATAPVDIWMGAFTQTVGGQFGALVKSAVPVWRPRPLFNGRIVFMTTFDYATFDHDGANLPRLHVVQAEAGLLHNVPSARPAGQVLPAQKDYRLWCAPATDADGRPLSLATPSPCPAHHVVLAGAPLEAGEANPSPGRYGIYLTSDDKWGDTDASLTLLFDDPELVDAEPVAVYARQSKFWPTKPTPTPTDAAPADELRLANGTIYRGPAGTLFNSALYAFQVGDLPGQQTDIGAGPIYDRPPTNSIHTIRVYASRRDRFDDPVKPRVVGEWELLVDAPVTGDTLGARLPAGVPTVLAGFDQAGRVVRWTTAAKDSKGRQATFYAFAGDHYSAVGPLGKNFCIGCHPGHSSLGRSDHNHAEKLQ